MNRKLTNALASAALLAFISAPAAFAQQTTKDAHGNERTGQKSEKQAQHSCPVHPEVKVRGAGKCPECRIDARREQQNGRAKGEGKVRQRPQQSNDSNN